VAAGCWLGARGAGNGMKNSTREKALRTAVLVLVAYVLLYFLPGF
jgi:hypothetical protein